MKSRTVARFALLVSLVSLPAVAEGEVARRQQAHQHFERGVSLYRAKSWDAALIEFRRAYELAPSHRVLYNVGQAAMQAGDAPEALGAFRRYLSEGGASVPAKRRTEVEASIADLQARVASVTIKVDALGADVLVDDRVVGKSPLSEAVLVSAGRHKISATEAGRAPVVRNVDFAGGDQVEVNLVLRPKSPQAERTTLTRREAPAPPASRTPFWFGVGATALLAVGATVTGVLAMSAKSDYDDEIGAYPTTGKKIEDRRSRVRGLALATDILIGAAVVAGGVTLYLGLEGSTPARARAGTSKPNGASRWALTVSGPF